MVTRNSEKFFNYLKSLHNKYLTISDQLSAPEITRDRKKFASLSRELSGLKSISEKFLQYEILVRRLNESEELFNISSDLEMKQLAEEDIRELHNNIKSLEDEIKLEIVSDSDEDNRNIFLEIRAGAGGDEASLFASDMLRMYLRVSERNGWKLDIISTNYTGVGGIKEITTNIRGSGVNRFLKYESGVHRVQRVPQTESSGRIHTSTVTVAVMPEIDDIEIEINPADIRIDTYRASGAGGQHVNKTESAIRITHFPTGIVVSCQDESSQHKNRDKAMRVLKSRLYEHEKNKRESDIANDRRSKVGTGERSEKIRTYNFPQNRVTDHRISGIKFNLETVLDGNLKNIYEQVNEIKSRERVEQKLKEIAEN